MPDTNDNDIEELFCLLDHVIGGQRHRAALTALVAERDSLRAELAAAIKERDEARGQTWYLLYGGTSEDGMGSGSYIGRTTDKKIAQMHHSKCRQNPYSIGFVEIVTDTEKKQPSFYDTEWHPKKKGGDA